MLVSHTLRSLGEKSAFSGTGSGEFITAPGTGEFNGEFSAALAAAVATAIVVLSAVGNGMRVGTGEGVMMTGGVTVAVGSAGEPHAASASATTQSAAARLVLRNMRAILLC